VNICGFFCINVACSDLGSPLLNTMINNIAPESAVVKSIKISVFTNDVWRALTEPDKIAQWMGGALTDVKNLLER
jgi:hypothetical protein